MYIEQAFLKAWKDVCKSKSDTSQLIIPAGKTFLLRPIAFNGPCNSNNIYIQVLFLILVFLQFSPSKTINHDVRVSN